MFNKNENVKIGDVRTEEYYVIHDIETDKYYSGNDEWDGYRHFLDHENDIIKDAFKFKTLDEAKVIKSNIVEEMAVANNLPIETLEKELRIKKVYDNFTVIITRQQYVEYVYDHQI